MLILSCKTEKEERIYSSAINDIKNEKVEVGLKNLELILVTSPDHPYALKAALFGADTSFKKPDFKEYFQKFCKFIVVHSKDEEEQIEFQTKLAQSYFESGDYANAVLEFQRVLSKPNFIIGRYETLIELAKSYFFMRKFDQALIEIKKVTEGAPSKELRYQGHLLVANILSSNKQYKEALDVYKKIQNEDSGFYNKNNLGLSVALIYEETEELDKAIEALQSMTGPEIDKVFIEDKIQRLRDRKELLPSAGGLEK